MYLHTVDVFVIGGGPAGLAAAIAARREGFRVMLADPARPPIDKACGEGLMPGGVESLRRLGVPIDAAGVVFRGIRFRERDSLLEAGFRGGGGIGMRRAELHRLLLEHASSLGVHFCWNAAVRGIDDNHVLMNGRNIPCRWLIAADGQNSAVRRWAGLDRGRVRARRYGFRRHFRVTRWTNHVEVHWGEGCQAFVTPVAADEVCVALLARNPRARFQDLYAAFPELGRRLTQPTSPARGSVVVMRRLRRVVRGRVALIGDASGSLDPISGEGLTLAFRQAVALGEALARGDLAHYQAAHRRIALLPEVMTRLLLQMDRRHWLRRRVFGAFAWRPALFSGMLALHGNWCLTPFR